MKRDLAAPESQLIERANALHKKFTSTLKKGASFAFEIGKILKGIYENRPATESWPQYVAEHFSFSYQTASTYIRVYENFKDNPKLLAKQTISGALKLLSAPPKEKRGPVEYGSPGQQLELPWETIFSKPPVSNAKLKNHRFECIGAHDIYLIQRGLNFPVKVVDLLTDDPSEHLKAPYQGMLDSMQAALELYFAEVERLEALNKA
jgi:hypothetical protein